MAHNSTFVNDWVTIHSFKIYMYNVSALPLTEHRSEIMTSGNKTKLLIYAESGTSSSCAIRYVLSELWYIFVSDCIHNPSGHFNVETTLFQWITATLNQRWNMVAYMYKSCNFVSTSKVEEIEMRSSGKHVDVTWKFS